MTQVALVGRILRCVRNSTEFRVSRGVLGTRYERRQMPASGEWVEGGAELFRYWFGDRTHQILGTAEPVLGAVFRPLLPRKHRLYVRALGDATLQATFERLQDGYDQFLALRKTN